LNFNIFDQAESPLLQWILDKATPLSIDLDTCIVKEGDLADGLFIVKSGQLVIDTTADDGSSVILAEQGAGSLVGEMSWLENRPAVARVLAKAGSKLLQLKPAALAALRVEGHFLAASLYRTIGTKLSLQIKSQNAWIHRFNASANEPLRKVLVLFAELIEQDVDWMRQLGRLHRVRAGEVLLDQGQPVTSVYLVLAGEARIQVQIESQLQVVGSSRRGELLGEMTLVNSAATGASARVDTTEGLELLAFDIIALESALNADASRATRFWRALARMLSQRSRDQLLERGLAARSRQAESERDAEEIDITQLSGISTAGARFDWLCRQFQNQEV
jgi:bacteriocin-type transport-associated protein